MPKSAFDPDQFLNQEVNANFESEYTPVPEGEFEAQVSKVDVSSYVAKSDEFEGQDRPILKLTWRINDPGVTEETGIEEPRVTQAIFLDYRDGVLEEGANKNIMLGRLIELGNIKKDGFRLTDLEGVSCIVKVKHRMSDDNRPMAEVRDVTEI